MKQPKFYYAFICYKKEGTYDQKTEDCYDFFIDDNLDGKNLKEEKDIKEKYKPLLFLASITIDNGVHFDKHHRDELAEKIKKRYKEQVEKPLIDELINGSSSIKPVGFLNNDWKKDETS